MSEVTKKELIKAVTELNDKICDPPIKKKDEKKMGKKLLIAAKLIEKNDNISKKTMEVIKTLKAEKKGKSSSTEKSSKKSDKKKSKKTRDKKKVKKNSTNKKLGIGTFIVENLQSGKFKKLSDQQIVDRVIKKFPEANTKASNISGYRKIATA